MPEKNILILHHNCWDNEMSDNVCSVELLIQNKKGLHARAAASFVKCAEEFNAEVIVEKSGQSVSGCSIMGLMMLAAAKGTTIEVKICGPQAQDALEAISTLVNNKFGEE